MRSNSFSLALGDGSARLQGLNFVLPCRREVIWDTIIVFKLCFEQKCIFVFEKEERNVGGSSCCVFYMSTSTIHAH